MGIWKTVLRLAGRNANGRAHTVLLKPGDWLGRGSLLVEGASLGRQIECDLRIEQDRGGFTLAGGYRVKGDRSQDFSVRIAPNDVGTYTVDARMGAVAADGNRQARERPQPGAPVERERNAARRRRPVRCADGCGFRGFLHEDERTLTWEIAFSRKQHAVKADKRVHPEEAPVTLIRLEPEPQEVAKANVRYQRARLAPTGSA